MVGLWWFLSHLMTGRTHPESKHIQTDQDEDVDHEACRIQWAIDTHGFNHRLKSRFLTQIQ